MIALISILVSLCLSADNPVSTKVEIPFSASGEEVRALVLLEGSVSSLSFVSEHVEAQHIDFEFPPTISNGTVVVGVVEDYPARWKFVANYLAHGDFAEDAHASFGVGGFCTDTKDHCFITSTYVGYDYPVSIRSRPTAGYAMAIVVSDAH